MARSFARGSAGLRAIPLTLVSALSLAAQQAPSVNGAVLRSAASVSLDFTAMPIQAPGTAEIRVFYATNRAVKGIGRQSSDYSVDHADDNLSFGTCVVSIPRDHRMGVLETASIWRLEFANDPRKHITLKTIVPQEREEFLRHVRVRMSQAKSKKKEILVFVHGFNTSFEDAVRRTGQLAYDLGFDGAPIAFTWPSRSISAGVETTSMLARTTMFVRTEYQAAEDNAEISVPALRVFLDELSRRSGATTIHLVAHSMGARLLVRALSDAALQDKLNHRTLVRQVIIAAPDIDVRVFKQLAKSLRSDPTTLYASSNDRALALSRIMHDDRRAGEAGQGILVLPGIDTIDVSYVDTSLDGHSYYGDNKTVVSDLFYLLRGLPPKDRFGLKQMSGPTGLYWLFRP
jgi:esterase/lipase superfamily enzyme